MTEQTSTAIGAGGLTPLDLGVIAVYLLGVVGMGFWFARRQRSTDDFFVGGRNLPSWAVGISIFASLLSTITYLGTPGEMFRSGILFMTRHLAVPFVLVVVWFLWLPFFMRLKLTSAYEYLERRFDYPTRVLAAVFCILLLLGWISVVVLSASMALSEIAALDLEWFFGTNTPTTVAADGTVRPGYADADMHAIILCVGLFSVVYTTLGGIRAVVWTDVIQFLILMTGACVTMAAVAVMTDSGLGDWLRHSRSYQYERVEWFDWDVGNRSTVTFIATGMFVWYICTHGANQMALQRYFSVKDAWAARRSYLYSALLSVVLGMILAGVGISLMYFVQDHHLPASADLHAENTAVRNTAQDAVFPQFIRYYLPSGLRGIIVAALFAAAMSTIDSGANSVSTIVTVDFFRRLSRGPRSAAAELRLARILTGSMGIIVVACTVFLYHISKGTDLMTMCQKGFNCFIGPLGGLFVLGMFVPTVTGRSAIPAVLCGEIVGISASYSEELFGVPFSTHLVVPSGFASTVLAGLVFSLLLWTRADEEQQRWMWLPVVRSSEPSDSTELN